jgi:hypothetical protein
LDVTAEACTFPALGLGCGCEAAGAGEKHENLSADGADWYAFEAIRFTSRPEQQSNTLPNS